MSPSRVPRKGQRALVAGLAVMTFATVPGCRDTLDPPSPAADIKVEVVANTPLSLARQEAGGWRLECHVELTAKAMGASGARATWEDAVIRVFTRPNQKLPTDSILFTAPKNRQSWRSDHITAEQEQRASWHLVVRNPFRASAEIRYRPDGAAAPLSTAFPFHCGAEIPDTAGSVPWIQQVRIEPGEGEVEPGVWKPVLVSYKAGSVVPLARLELRVSGSISHVEPLEVRSEYQVTRTSRVEVGPLAKLGERLRFQVYAVDVAGRETTTPWIDGPTVVDRTPPGIQEIRLKGHPRSSAPASARLVGNYADTDTLKLELWAADNHQVKYVVYSLGAPVNVRDSIATGTMVSLSDAFQIPLRREWIGSPPLTVYVRDAAGNKSMDYGSPPDSFFIYPERTRATHSVRLDGTFNDAVVDPVRQLLYLAFSDAIAVVPLDRPNSVSRIGLPGRPRSLDLAPDGRTLVVALAAQGAFAVLDAENLAAAPKIVPTTGELAAYGPIVLRFNRRGTVVALASDPTSHARFLEFDPASGAQVARTGRMPYGGYGAAARTPDYGRIAFNVDQRCGLVYDAVEDRFGSCQPIQSTGSISVSADGSRFAKGYGVYDRNLERIQDFLPYGTYTTSISPDGTELFISGPRGLVRSRVIDAKHVERTPLPPVYNGMLLFTRGNRLLVAVGQMPEFGAKHTWVHLINLE